MYALQTSKNKKAYKTMVSGSLDAVTFAMSNPRVHDGAKRRLVRLSDGKVLAVRNAS